MNNEHVSFMPRVLSDESSIFLLTYCLSDPGGSDAAGRARPWYLSQFIWFRHIYVTSVQELGIGPGTAVTKMKETYSPIS